MGVEQSELLVLLKERTVPIGQSAGIRVASSTLVWNGMVVANLILTCSRIFIVGKVEGNKDSRSGAPGRRIQGLSSDKQLLFIGFDRK